MGSIDDDGYLRRETAAIVDDLAFRQNIESNEAEMETLIKQIQQFDPAGVARPQPAGMPAAATGHARKMTARTLRRPLKC